MPSNDPRPTKAQRQADARARAAEIRRQQENAQKRNRFLAIGGAILAVVVIVGAVAFVLVQNRQNATTYGSVAFGGVDSDNSALVAPALADVKAPSTADASGGIPVSSAGVGKTTDGDTVLQVYFDMQCPVCQQFDSINSGDLQALAQEPGITVLYQPLSFLDDKSSGTHYSNRAANALMTVADQDPEHFEAFMTALFKNQPAENSHGITDDQIASIATGVGVPQAVTDQFTTVTGGTYQVKDASGNTSDKTGNWRTFAPFIAAATAHAATLPAFPNGIGTHTLVLNGTVIGNGGSDGVNWTQSGSLKSAVEAAAAAKG
ncbi:MAG TPA: thioredoxin domain-containing protein [Cellulomonas sp.]